MLSFGVFVVCWYWCLVGCLFSMFVVWFCYFVLFGLVGGLFVGLC